jgi:hypothetical protein
VLGEVEALALLIAIDAQGDEEGDDFQDDVAGHTGENRGVEGRKDLSFELSGDFEIAKATGKGGGAEDRDENGADKTADAMHAEDIQ